MTATTAADAHTAANIRWFSEVDSADRPLVGGKAASLGEMYQKLRAVDVRVPNGFVTTVEAYRAFVAQELPRSAWHELIRRLTELGSKDDLDPSVPPSLRDAIRLVLRTGTREIEELADGGELIRKLIMSQPVPDTLGDEIREAYGVLCKEYGREVDTAVRSSATREDLGDSSFAGQYESYLNIRGSEEILQAWHRCAASAFTDRAVSYQIQRGLDPADGDLAVVVMKMVRSDLATSGVMFTLDPESGNRNVIHITSAYGLGEFVVQGSVQPDTVVLWKKGLERGRNAIVHRTLGAKDRKLVYSMQGGTATESMDVDAARRRRWSLTREESTELARMALTIEEHYGRPMDIEWAKDGHSGKLYIVQARPETVHSGTQQRNVLRTYSMDAELVRSLKSRGKALLRGQAVGTRIGTGKVRVYDSFEGVIEKKRVVREALKGGRALEEIPPEEHVFDKGDVLVTELTTPDWEPLMKDASLIVTEKGGRTSHAAIVAREFGIPAIVGAEDARGILKPLQEVTGSCAEGELGVVYEGIHEYRIEEIDLGGSEPTETLIKLNVGFPDKALHDAMLPCDGVGLARLEFILTAEVGIHPFGLLYYDELKRYVDRGELDPALERYRGRLEREDPHELKTLVGAIERRTPAYADKREFFVDQLKYGVGLICAAFHPRPVLVRLSDLKSNEYRDLLAGRLFEPVEENPMIAWRGASRYIDPAFTPAFDMEADALRWVRQDMGLDNLQLMVPFCRSPEEGEAVVRLLDQRGLSPEAGVPLFLMVEIPSNVIESDRFIDWMSLSGGSIGSNDLVQTSYAVSRDDLEGYAFAPDTRSSSVKALIRRAIDGFRSRGLEIGICGQAPSDHPKDIPAFLVEAGITSISVTPDSFQQVRVSVREAEERLQRAEQWEERSGDDGAGGGDGAP
ncbi:MAG: phosphoenolpyruvate synthase [Longimicrobiales bacterium]|nr:phosphoenolpyruvate synthase [Longimicrobiales bacterium]